MTLDCRCIIVAGGSGTRFGGDMPKQYRLLDGRPVLMHTVDAFRRLFAIDKILTVISEPMKDYWLAECRRYGFEAGPIAFGGVTRWESVKNGLDALTDAGKETYVLVHDAARPCVSLEVITGVIETLEGGAVGAVPVVEINDSMRRIGTAGNSVPVNRDEYRAVQTPQGFPYTVLRKAFEMPFDVNFTDEATMIERAGLGTVVLTRGSHHNIKITRLTDLKIAELLLKENA